MPNPVVKQIAVKNGSEYTTADIGTSADKITYGNNSDVATQLDALTTAVGNKSTVAVTPAAVSGILVGTITIDENNNNYLYAPIVANRDGASSANTLTELTVGNTDYIVPQGTNVEANPATPGSVNLENLVVGSTTYKIPSGGSTVSVNQTLSSGTEVGGVVVNGTETKLYVPTPVNVVANPSGSADTNLTKITIGSTNYNIPSGGGGSTVTWNQIQATGTKIAEVSINGSSTDVYAPNGGSTTLNGLSDVNLSSPSNGQVLKFDGTEWVNADESGGGASGSGQWVDLTGTLTAGSTILTISNSIIDVDSTFDIYTSVFGVNPTNVIAFTQGITLYFDAQPNDIGVKVRVTSDYMPGGNGNVSGSIPTSVTVTEVTE